MNKVYLLLGSNIGDRESFLSKAIELIKINAGKIITKSSVYNTAAWGNIHQADFLNLSLCIETRLSAHELLKTILTIEKNLGRTRSQKWESRIIDIDILFFNSEIINTPALTIPHPFLHQRKFVLVPLIEIAGDFIHPILKKKIKKLLSEIEDNSAVSIHTK